MADTSIRRIDPGACLWCGHAPHDTDCNNKIRIGKEEEARCTCKQHVWYAERAEAPTSPKLGASLLTETSST